VTREGFKTTTGELSSPEEEESVFKGEGSPRTEKDLGGRKRKLFIALRKWGWRSSGAEREKKNKGRESTGETEGREDDVVIADRDAFALGGISYLLGSHLSSSCGVKPDEKGVTKDSAAAHVENDAVGTLILGVHDALKAQSTTQGDLTESPLRTPGILIKL